MTTQAPRKPGRPRPPAISEAVSRTRTAAAKPASEKGNGAGEEKPPVKKAPGQQPPVKKRRMVSAIDDILGDIGDLTKPAPKTPKKRRKPLNIINRS